MFCIYLRTNSDLCHLQRKLTGFYNWDEKCLLRGTDWIFKYNSLPFVFRGLMLLLLSLFIRCHQNHLSVRFKSKLVLLSVIRSTSSFVAVIYMSVHIAENLVSIRSVKLVETTPLTWKVFLEFCLIVRIFLIVRILRRSVVLQLTAALRNHNVSLASGPNDSTPAEKGRIAIWMGQEPLWARWMFSAASGQKLKLSCLPPLCNLCTDWTIRPYWCHAVT